MMENIFRCNSTKIHLGHVHKVGKDFISIDWTLKEEYTCPSYTSICHISSINLQKSIGKIKGSVYEVNGVEVNSEGYYNILKLL